MASLLSDVAMTYVKLAAPSFNNDEALQQIHQSFDNYIKTINSKKSMNSIKNLENSFEKVNETGDENTLREELVSILQRAIQTIEPLEKIDVVLSVPETPPPINRSEYFSESIHSLRKKTRPWSSPEDIRLLAGINKFGLDNWISVSKFVGNGRSRAQCAQRWVRGLDPRISKDQWSQEEEEKMLELIKTSSNKGWTTIAAGMGNRSDVQCRYHFLQMQREGKLVGEYANLIPVHQEKQHSPPIPLPQKGRNLTISKQNSIPISMQPNQQQFQKIQRQRSFSMQSGVSRHPPPSPFQQKSPFQPPFQPPIPQIPAGQITSQIPSSLKGMTSSIPNVMQQISQTGQQNPFAQQLQHNPFQSQNLIQSEMRKQPPLPTQNFQPPNLAPFPAYQSQVINNPSFVPKSQRRSSLSTPKPLTIFDEFGFDNNSEDDIFTSDIDFLQTNSEELFPTDPFENPPQAFQQNTQQLNVPTLNPPQPAQQQFNENFIDWSIDGTNDTKDGIDYQAVW
ncbi:hypothetical protein TRFO_28606 [Tritrichomonas foetus]|uniref:Myb-like DNA-binding domain containing protein n=1 Tax=Tritrichomonas foetus TaxID=1144522 RepID=A0A1J4K2N0_9EUKA|nr:hypothetical protein TRFO_28606 [Tritrichomonas foetus]|eukprot:OHT04004.1 hypothetical protein TRFO_28606 [Tritrichomonas foetus]